MSVCVWICTTLRHYWCHTVRHLTHLVHLIHLVHLMHLVYFFHECTKLLISQSACTSSRISCAASAAPPGYRQSTSTSRRHAAASLTQYGTHQGPHSPLRVRARRTALRGCSHAMRPLLGQSASACLVMSPSALPAQCQHHGLSKISTSLCR